MPLFWTGQSDSLKPHVVALSMLHLSTGQRRHPVLIVKRGLLFKAAADSMSSAEHVGGWC